MKRAMPSNMPSNVPKNVAKNVPTNVLKNVLSRSFVIVCVSLLVAARAAQPTTNGDPVKAVAGTVLAITCPVFPAEAISWYKGEFRPLSVVFY